MRPGALTPAGDFIIMSVSSHVHGQLSPPFASLVHQLEWLGAKRLRVTEGPARTGQTGTAILHAAHAYGTGIV